MHADELAVDAGLVRRLLWTQFPAIAELELTPVEPWGTDNAIWRLGEDLVVRLPRIGWASGQPDLDASVLPRVAGVVPVPVPEPLAVGAPGAGYPHRWSIHRWVEGHAADLSTIPDPVTFAMELAEVVRALAALDPSGAPAAINRARPLRQYHESALSAIQGAARLIDADAARAVWEAAANAPAHEGPPVWVHGDLDGNCLVSGGHLSGLVDWGCCCAGDPAVDIAVVWSELFTLRSRAAFLDALDVDAATVLRSRGAAVQQACAALPYYLNTYPEMVRRSWHKLHALGIPARRFSGTRRRRLGPAGR
jgi:aminoglycoside phosphotransferase (APT) family kinase protein